MTKRFKIEVEVVPGRWSTMPFFGDMRKSFADGAWAMLKSFNGGGKNYRLVEITNGNKIIDNYGTGTIKLN